MLKIFLRKELFSKFEFLESMIVGYLSHVFIGHLFSSINLFLLMVFGFLLPLILH